MPQFLGLAVISLAIGIVFTLFYGKVSAQNKIKGVKKLISAYISEAVLYKHDPVLTIKAQGKLIATGLKYLGTTIFPICILFIPSLILFTSLQNQYGFSALSAGSSSELVVTAKKEADLFKYKLISQRGMSATLPLRIPETDEIVFRVQALENAPSTSISKDSNTADISELFNSKLPFLMSSHWWESFLYGTYTAPPLGLERIELDKPSRSFSVFGLRYAWYVWSILFILIGGLFGAKIFKISF